MVSLKSMGECRQKVRRTKGRRRRKLNLRRTEKGINFIYGSACTEIMRFSAQISCVCLKSLQSGKSGLATGPSPLHADPETAESLWPVLASTQRQLRREFWDSALGYEVFTSDAVPQLHNGKSLSQKERTVKNVLLPDDCFFPGPANNCALNLTFISISKVNRYI